MGSIYSRWPFLIYLQPENFMKLLGLLTVSLYANAALFAQSWNLTDSLVYDSIFCTADTSQSYALFRPPDQTHTIPVIYILDPMARGRQGIEVFRKAADKYGFLLACSNNARNGSWEHVFMAAEAMMQDVNQRFNIDTSRQYIAGFSGGSRAAMSIAVLTDGSIRGVIGCGAGKPPVINYQPDAQSDFYYLGLVGHHDMNFREHQLLADELSDMGLENSLYIFAGKHQWPTSDVIELALIELQVLHHHRPKNSWLRHYVKLVQLYGESWGDIFPQLCISALNRVMTRIPVVASTLSDYKIHFAEQKGLRKIMALNRKIAQAEDEEISVILSMFRQIKSGRVDFEAWKAKILSLHELSSASKAEQWRFFSYRMVNLIWARAAESAFREEKATNFDLAHIYTNIWQYADANSPKPYWYQAKLYALQGKSEHALRFLELAYDHGMQFRHSLGDHAFDSLRLMPRFKLLHDKLIH